MTKSDRRKRHSSYKGNIFTKRPIIKTSGVRGEDSRNPRLVIHLISTLEILILCGWEHKRIMNAECMSVSSHTDLT